MKRTLKALALAAGVLCLGMPAFAAKALPDSPVIAKIAAPAKPAATKSPSYAEVKAQFKLLIAQLSNAVNSAQMGKLTGDMLGNVDMLARLERDYAAAKSKPGVKPADLDTIVQNYAGTVQSIEQAVAQLAETEQQIGQAVNAGLTVLVQVDAAKAESDPELQAMVGGLQKALIEKIDAPAKKAATAVAPLAQSVQSAVQARLQALMQEELKRAVSNRLESKSSQ